MEDPVPKLGHFWTTGEYDLQHSITGRMDDDDNVRMMETYTLLQCE